MMRSSFCCQLQHPLPPSLSNVWWDIKRRHWATRDGCTPRDGTCLQCLEAVGVLWNPSPTILEPKTCLKNPEKNEDFLSANGEILHIIQGTKWDRDWLDLDLMTFRDASPKKKTVTIRDTTIPPSYVSDSPVSGDIANCSSSWWNCTVFFHSSPTNNYIILTSSVANLSNILARSIYQVDWTFVVLCAPRQCHPSFPHPPSLGQTWKLQHGSNYQSSEYLKPRVMFFETIL